MSIGPVVLWFFLYGCGSAPSPPPSLFHTDTPEPGIPSVGGLRFEALAGFPEVAHHSDVSDKKLMPEIMGPGVAVVDLNRDGALDIVLPDGGRLLQGPIAKPVVLLGDGRGGFTDVTTAWGLVPQGYGMGIAAGDIDNDGWTDLYLSTYGGQDRLLRNDGERFIDVTEEWGIHPQGWSTSAAFLDIDQDGDLDLYVVRYVDFTPENNLKCWFKAVHVYCTPGMYDALPDKLYRNDGGRFVDISAEAGIDRYRAKGLAVGTGDLNRDGHVDIYVADDITRNLLWMGAGDGTFAEKGILAGVAYSEVGKEEASMGVAIADADRDGVWDVAVTNFQGEPTSIYYGRKSGYRERSDAVGVGAPSRARLAFGIEWFDADNDGDDDLIQANGHINLAIHEYRESVTAAQTNTLFQNTDGKFNDVGEAAGPPFAVEAVSRGLAVGDLNGDGGVDFVVTNNSGVAEAVINRTPNRGAWLSLWLEGTTSNRSAIGAVVTARWGEEEVMREVRGASSYLSVSSRFVHLGLGDHKSVDELEVRWPDGRVQKFAGVEGERHLHIVQGSAPVSFIPGEKIIAP